MRSEYRAAAAVIVLCIWAGCAIGAEDPPNPYVEDGWAKLPDGRRWGAVGAIDLDRNGHLWAAERCGGNSCADNNVPPVIELDASGKYLKSFGAGIFSVPHGIAVDRDGNVWVTDQVGKGGKGHVVVKFSAEGKVLMTLGKPGVAGTTEDTFNQPSDVIVAPNGDIFVADGHGGDSNARIVKFSKDGKFIKTWGKKGSAPGEFDTPHGLAFDSQRGVHRRQRHALCRRSPVECENQSGCEARHPHRQREGRHGEGICAGPRHRAGCLQCG